MKPSSIKYVKVAKSYCLTWFEEKGKDYEQKQKWFDTEQEALKMIKEIKCSS